MTISVDGCDMSEYKSLEASGAGSIFSINGGPEDLEYNRDILDHRGFTRLESSSMKWADYGVGKDNSIEINLCSRYRHEVMS